MSPQEKQLLKAALVYWRKKTIDMTPEAMAWLDATRERRLNLLTAIEEGIVAESLWQETAVIMIQIFHFIERHGYWSAWIPTLEKAIKHCSKPSLYEFARLQSQLSQLYRKGARFNEAYQLYVQVLKFAKEKPYIDLIVTIYRDKAEFYIAQNQLDDAESSGLTALEWLDDKDDQMAAFVYETMGKVFRLKGKNKKALHFYQKASIIRNILGETYLLANALNDTSLVLAELEEYDSALKILNEAMILSEESDFPDVKYLVMNNRGFIFYRKNQLEEAEKAFMKIDFLGLKRRGSLRACGQSLQNIGNVKLKQGNLDDAQPYIAEAINLFRSIWDEVHLANSLGTLAEILVCQQQNEQAKLYFDEAIQLLEKYPNNVWGQRLLKDFEGQRRNC